MRVSVAEEKAPRLERVKVKTKRGARERIARYFDPIIFYALLALLPLVAIPYGTVEPWWEALFEAAIFALSALWLIEGMIRGGSWLVAGHKIFLPLFVLVLFIFVQSFPLSASGRSALPEDAWLALSADPYETRRVGLKFLALALAGVLLVRYTSGRGRLRALVYVLIGVGVASALFGIIRQSTQDAPGFFLPYLMPDAGFGQFINRNHFAYLMEMALGLSLGFVVESQPRERVLIHLVPALLIWTALILSNSRGGLLSMLAQVILFGLLFSVARPSRSRRSADGESLSAGLRRATRSIVFRVVMVAALAAVVFLGAVWMGGEPLANRFEAMRSEVEVSASTELEGGRRAVIWAATWDLIKARPVAGAGFGGYWIAISQFHKASGEVVPQQAHNDYLELLASGGLVALLIAAWFLVWFIKRVRVRLRTGDSMARATCVGALVGLFGVAVHSLVDFGLHITINALFFVALLVIATIETQASPHKRHAGKSLATGSAAGPRV